MLRIGDSEVPRVLADFSHHFLSVISPTFKKDSVFSFVIRLDFHPRNHGGRTVSHVRLSDGKYPLNNKTFKYFFEGCLLVMKLYSNHTRSTTAFSRVSHITDGHF